MELCDSINFQINGKLRRIELYLGDITELPKSDEVDLLLVSAFPNNYAPIPGTLIGGLHSNLKISIKALAQDKGEDLRTNFHCWISKPLSNTLSFKRILCFEQGRGKQTDITILENPVSLVGAVFRALFTAFRDKEWSMITPILATGNQGSNKRLMIRVMAKACASWIIAGMPLECMKIVIYRANSDSPISKYDKEAIDEFSKLKSELNWKPCKDTLITIITHVLFIYVKRDEEIVKLFIKIFEESASEEKCVIKLKCINDSEEHIDAGKENDFERDIIQSKKVVLFLTPAFLETPEAVEKYNLVLCLSHKTHRNMLSPIYLLNIDHIPEYMTLNQWIDCRLKNIEENQENKFLKASKSLLNILHEKENDKASSENIVLNENKSNNYTEQFFDIFISYCHKDSNFANNFLSFLKTALPNKNIFYDKSEIKSGYSWQETLYYGVNNSKLVLTLLSENYFNSNMCSEEFSVALSQHQSPKFNTHLLPIWISNKPLSWDIHDKILNSMKFMFGVLKILVPEFTDPQSDNISEIVRTISICQELLTKFIGPILLSEMPRQISSIMKRIDLEESALVARTKFFQSTWNVTKSFDSSPNIEKTKFINCSKQATDIIIAFHEDDFCFADILKSFILDVKKNLTIKFSTMGPRKNGYKSMDEFENASLIVILLNPYYISTKSCQTQLQIALSLHRRQSGSGFRIFPLILETLPEQPSYIHLLPCHFKADDEIFQQIINKYGNTDQMRRILQFKQNCYNNEKIITLKAQLMLFFAASWIGKGLFHHDCLSAPITPVIYSTYDLITTSFDSQKLIDPHVLRDQIEPIEISTRSMDLAKEFIKNCKDQLNETETVRNEENKLMKSSKRKIPKIVPAAKPCSVM